MPTPFRTLRARHHRLAVSAIAASALLLLVAVGALAACGGTPTDASAAKGPPLLPAGGRHVLFVGNSLTTANGLPTMLERIAASGGDTIRTYVVAFSNYALVDHLDQGSAVDAIGRGQWAYVVLQQGPSTLPESRDSLVVWTELFATPIREHGATPALFMVWPDTTRVAFIDDCRRSYLAASDAVRGLFLPAGEAWGRAWQLLPALALYGVDGFHPSPAGTYLAALVMYERMTKHDARLLPVTELQNGVPTGVPAGLDTGTVRVLLSAAHEVSQRYP